MKDLVLAGGVEGSVSQSADGNGNAVAIGDTAVGGWTDSQDGNGGA